MSDLTVNELAERLAALREITDAPFKLNIAHVNEMRAMMEKRLESMNEFRDAIRDAANNSMLRTEYEAKHSQLDARISSLEKIVWSVSGGLLLVQIVLTLF